MIHKIGERLSTYRKERKMSQEEMAAILNVSRQTISKWENGETLPDMYNAVAFAKMFRVSLDELILGASSRYGGTSYFSQIKEERKKTNMWAIIIGSIGSTTFATSMILLRALDASNRTAGITMACVIPVLFTCWVYAIWGFIKVSRLNDELEYLERQELINIQVGNTVKQES